MLGGNALLSVALIHHRQVGKKRPSDVASSYANVSKAEQELMWVARLGVDRMCKDLWRWQNMNPAGYNKPDKEFGAFKPVAFSKANMPKLSSEDRPKVGVCARASMML